MALLNRLGGMLDHQNLSHEVPSASCARVYSRVVGRMRSRNQGRWGLTALVVLASAVAVVVSLLCLPVAWVTWWTNTLNEATDLEKNIMKYFPTQGPD